MKSTWIAIPFIALVTSSSMWCARADDAPPVAAPGAPAVPPAAPVAPPAARPAPTATSEQAADAVLAAAEAKDVTALGALALRSAPDPWLVVDELIRRDRLDAADAFARAAPRAAVEKLPGYVASRRGRSDDGALRRRLVAANAAILAKKPQEALDALGADEPARMDDVVGVRLAVGRARVLDSLGRSDEAHTAFLSAARAAESIGWLSRASTAYDLAAVAAHRRSAYAVARDAWERSLAIDEALGDRAGAARTLTNLGAIYHTLGDRAKALATLQRALAAMEMLGDQAGAADALVNMGVVYDNLGRYAEALAAYERALAMQESLGDRAGAAATLGNIGVVHANLGDYAQALSSYERALAAKEALGDRAGMADTLGNIGNVHQKRGDYVQALSIYRRVLAEHEAVGDRAGAALVLGNMGVAHLELGDYAQALSTLERALAAKEALGDRAGMADTLGNIGNVRRALGDYAAALSIHERARAAHDALGNRAGAARALCNIGLVHHDLGNFAQALSALDRALAAQEALGDREGVAVTLANLGLVYGALGDPARAISTYERALAAQEAMGNGAGAARTLGNIGVAQRALGEFAKALSTYERALVVQRAAGERAAAAVTLGNIGDVQYALGNYATALSIHQRALAEHEAMGSRAWAAWDLLNIGNVQGALGDSSAALMTYERALAAYETLGDRAKAARTLGNMGSAYVSLGDFAKAIESTRRAIDAQALAVRGLSAEEGSGAREPLSFVFDTGARAAIAAGATGDLAYVIEAGRAGALLEGLASREAIWAAAVPPALRAEEATARFAQGRASAALRTAIDSGDLALARARRAELDTASERVAAVVARIQREAKAGAAILYPREATLDEIRASLAAGDALVLYVLLPAEAAALVVTKDAARIVALGPRAPIDAAAEAASDAVADLHGDPGVLAALSALVVKPLALDDGVRRVLVSPEGSLSYVPFAALLPERTFAYVPSGTTYRLLRDEEALRGEGVLALGDPDYLTKVDERSLAVNRGGATRLSPLPATRGEVEAVGDVKLLAGQATEAGLRVALSKRARWRAVHLACHGLIEVDRPARSSLAITADGDDDGFLTCLDVFRMKVPSDLVVLSACETGRGRVVKGEGIVGLTRAFMFAGSPRVICSLWKVDDEATRALMTRFYELWNPKDGTPGLPTAVALRRAQESVRATEKWKHPFFWAAWVLWGLAD